MGNVSLGNSSMVLLAPRMISNQPPAKAPASYATVSEQNASAIWSKPNGEPVSILKAAAAAPPAGPIYRT